jgi:hypothetical protein
MCNCKKETDLVDVEIEGNSIWIYEKDAEFLTDFKISFCPFCGENLQPESSKREDDIMYLKCAGCGEYKHIFADKNHMNRCGTPNSMET